MFSFTKYSYFVKQSVQTKVDDEGQAAPGCFIKPQGILLFYTYENYTQHIFMYTHLYMHILY